MYMKRYGHSTMSTQNLYFSNSQLRNLLTILEDCFQVDIIHQICSGSYKTISIIQCYEGYCI
jgi:hypothetical protein